VKTGGFEHVSCPLNICGQVYCDELIYHRNREISLPRVSVIIPTFNRAQFVTEAIDSVLSQSYKDYEIIVVDDGSTDDTKGTLKRYGEKIKYIYQKNSGVSAARNTGINEAKGVWVAFLDSDDEWIKNYLSVQVEQIRNFPRAVAHIKPQGVGTIFPFKVKKDSDEKGYLELPYTLPKDHTLFVIMQKKH
jgi:glycosyltransferase involved in cell wall biosynthesis